MSEQKKQIVERLLPFLVKKKALSEVGELISADVISHMDQYIAHGREIWIQWVRFINSRGRVTQLETLLEQLVVNPDESVTAYGRWKALRKGEEAVSDETAATYRIEDGTIVEIWTKRTNYPFVVGPLIQSRLGLLCVLLYFRVWRIFHPLPPVVGNK
jgi:hypothetical protein